MMTLITGAPGTGKTAALVQLLSELAEDRAIYVNGIPELKVPHIELKNPQDWMNEVPDGSAVVIDEVQRVWRPRAPGSKVPDHIAALETHRHRGLDFFIITQGPQLVDSNVRALIGRHVHLRDLGMLGRFWYEWSECSDNVRTGWKSAPIKKRYRLPKKIFDQYKSASMHVKPIRSVPVVLFVLIAAVIGAAFLTWRSYRSITERMSGGDVHKLDLPASAPGRGASDVVPANLGRMVKAGPVDERAGFDPRISDRPWTAPAYDDLRVVVRVPYIDGAMCINWNCVCFSGGQKLLDVSSKACREWYENRPFNPYVAAVETASGSTSHRANLSGGGAPGVVPATYRAGEAPGRFPG